MEKVIRFDQVNKSKEKKTILKNVFFSVKSGVIHGFIGPNGAGKTTALKILMRLFFPDSKKSEIYVEGKSITNDPSFNKNLGWIKAESEFLNEKVKDFILDFARLSSEFWSSHKTDEILNKAETFFSSLSSPVSLQQNCNSLSTGQKKLLNLFMLNICRPQKKKILILDEVFNGLDPILRHSLLENIKEIKKNGTTVVLSTHILQDLDELADDITIIKNGVIVYTGIKTDNLKSIYDKYFSDEKEKKITLLN